MSTWTIALLGGDGIGPEVVAEGVRVLEAVAAARGRPLTLTPALIGGAAIDATGDPLPEATRAAVKAADAVLLGAVGGPKWSDPHAPVRPEQGLLRLRAELGVYANLRPVKPHPLGAAASPVKADRLVGVDLLFVRELTGGIYFGEKSRDAEGATDLCRYTIAEIERVTRLAGRLARTRRSRITQVDKANVLETSRLWRAVSERVLKAEFPDVGFEHQLVDSMAMHLIARPASFDVILTENLLGDVLTDEAAILAGSLGVLPSASLGDGTKGLYEPIHGSAPDIAGRGIANPIGTILSVALMLEWSLGDAAAARAVEAAVAATLDAGIAGADLVGADGVGTRAIGDAVLARLELS